MIVLVWIAVIAMYFLYASAFFRLAKKAGLDSIAWYAFIPVLSSMLRLRLIRWTQWWVVVLFIPILLMLVFAFIPHMMIVVLLLPIVDFVFIVISQMRLLKAFNKHLAWVLLQVAFPIVYDILWVIWGYSDDTMYVQ